MYSKTIKNRQFSVHFLLRGFWELLHELCSQSVMSQIARQDILERDAPCQITESDYGGRQLDILWYMCLSSSKKIASWASRGSFPNLPSIMLRSDPVIKETLKNFKWKWLLSYISADISIQNWHTLKSTGIFFYWMWKIRRDKLPHSLGENCSEIL